MIDSNLRVKRESLARFQNVLEELIQYVHSSVEEFLLNCSVQEDQNRINAVDSNRNSSYRNPRKKSIGALKLSTVLISLFFPDFFANLSLYWPRKGRGQQIG
ncbi:hypothetical protein OROHE_027401 [Orobanche hederae]